MADPRQDVTGGPELETTPARQSQRSPGAFLMLCISTLVGAVVVGIIWLVFANPLHHTLSPHLENRGAANSFHEPPPVARLNGPATPGDTAGDKHEAPHQ